MLRVRTMKLESEIGVHWTMKCGNDIIEGSALIPAVAMVPPADPGSEASTALILLAGFSTILKRKRLIR
jgi:hypothetical protein